MRLLPCWHFLFLLTLLRHWPKSGLWSRTEALSPTTLEALNPANDRGSEHGNPAPVELSDVTADSGPTPPLQSCQIR